MVSFSVNSGINSKEKIERVVELVNQINEYNEEYAADVFFNIAEGNVDRVSLNGYAEKKVKEKKRKLHELNKNYSKVSLLTEEEAKIGFEGVLDIEDPTDYETPVIEDADTSYFVKTFLNLRQFIFFKEGFDIWRMIVLVRKGDAWVGEKFRMIAISYGVVEFFKEFCSNLNYVYAVQKKLGS